MRFRYKLQGLDREWVEAGDRRTAYYSHLPPGRYTFTVTGANSDGVWNQTGASLAVTVVPPFWRTWWFTGLAGLSVIAVAVGIVLGVSGRIASRSCGTPASCRKRSPAS